MYYALESFYSESFVPHFTFEFEKNNKELMSKVATLFNNVIKTFEGKKSYQIYKSEDFNEVVCIEDIKNKKSYFVGMNAVAEYDNTQGHNTIYNKIRKYNRVEEIEENTPLEKAMVKFIKTSDKLLTIKMTYKKLDSILVKYSEGIAELTYPLITKRDKELSKVMKQYKELDDEIKISKLTKDVVFEAYKVSAREGITTYINSLGIFSIEGDTITYELLSNSISDMVYDLEDNHIVKGKYTISSYITKSIERVINMSEEDLENAELITDDLIKKAQKLKNKLNKKMGDLEDKSKYVTDKQELVVGLNSANKVMNDMNKYLVYEEVNANLYVINKKVIYASELALIVSFGKENERTIYNITELDKSKFSNLPNYIGYELDNTKDTINKLQNIEIYTPVNNKKEDTLSTRVIEEVREANEMYDYKVKRENILVNPDRISSYNKVIDNLLKLKEKGDKGGSLNIKINKIEDILFVTLEDKSKNEYYVINYNAILGLNPKKSYLDEIKAFKGSPKPDSKNKLDKFMEKNAEILKETRATLPKACNRTEVDYKKFDKLMDNIDRLDTVSKTTGVEYKIDMDTHTLEIPLQVATGVYINQSQMYFKDGTDYIKLLSYRETPTGFNKMFTEGMKELSKELAKAKVGKSQVQGTVRMLNTYKSNTDLRKK